MQEPHPLANLTRSHSRLSSRFQRRKIKNLSRCRGARDEAKKGTEKKKKTLCPPFVCGFLYAGRPAICIVDCAPTLPRVYWILSYLFRANTRGRRSPLFCAPSVGSLSTKIVFPPIHRERQRGRGGREREEIDSPGK